ncbi:uncharacterized protein LOC135427880 [Drosophila montana]|uniref:uncharacterized protein LOC135427880 n=1 Tax=Drosophila montana TaxID=40370 RepID=UPI00313E3F75
MNPGPTFTHSRPNRKIVLSKRTKRLPNHKNRIVRTAFNVNPDELGHFQLVELESEKEEPQANQTRSHPDSDPDSLPGQWSPSLVVQQADISIDGLGVADCIEYLNNQVEVDDSLLASINSAKLVSVRLGSNYYKDPKLKLNDRWSTKLQLHHFN